MIIARVFRWLTPFAVLLLLLLQMAFGFFPLVTMMDRDENVIVSQKQKPHYVVEQTLNDAIGILIL